MAISQLVIPPIFMNPTWIAGITVPASGSVSGWARKFVISALSHIEVGEVIVKDIVADETLKFGKPGKLSAVLVVKDASMWRRVLLGSSTGFAESYMLGEVECSNLETFLEIMIYNRDNVSDMKNMISSLISLMIGLARASNELSTSLANVKAHYDLSNDFFKAFLSPDLTYSCPLWLSSHDGESNIDSLEAAQIRKLHYIIQQAKIKCSDHVLEIGTGWGSFAIEAVKMTKCRVTSLTLSAEQKLEAETRIAAAGLQDHIKVLLKDYRELSDCGVQFDKIVSIEMMEHVGKGYLPEYFRIVNKLLKKKGGIAVFQSSTMPETRYRLYNEGSDFIRQSIFPGAHLPTLTKIIESAHEGAGGSLVPDGLLNMGGHYSRCLREWRSNFFSNFESKIVPAMNLTNGNITEAARESFKKRWMFYFSFCEAGFKTKTLGVSLVTFAREGAVETLEGITL